MRVRLLGAAALLLFTTGCVRHVVFTDQIRQHRPVDDVVRIYTDMHGDLYAAADVNPPASRIAKEETLRDAMRARSPEACSGASLPPEDAALCAAAASPDPASWDVAQQRLWDRAARQVSARLDGSARPLVVLIHGFNVVDSEAIYATARERVNALIGDVRPVFLQVHWDGYTGVHRQAWASGQYSGPLVGQRLRAIFNSLPTATPVRVLTHSSGGFIAASTFGDATAALPRAREAAAGTAPADSPYIGYVRNADSREPSNPLRVPALADVRIGMLVAATPPDTFVGNVLYPQGGFKLPGAMLVFGFNPHDQTIRKGFRLEQLSTLGATTLGARPEAVCDVRRVLSARPGATVHAVDVSDAPGESNPGMLGLLQSHKWHVYLDRERFTPFARLWLGLDAAPVATSFACPG